MNGKRIAWDKIGWRRISLWTDDIMMMMNVPFQKTLMLETLAIGILLFKGEPEPIF